MKLMYVVWGSRLADSLLSKDLHQRLAAVGATGLQVNTDVSQALPRLATYDRPLGAVVSVWTRESATAVTELISSVGDNLAGWLVQEGGPLPPPATGSGVRVDALSNIALLRIPEGMHRLEWFRRWEDHCTGIGMKNHATFGYAQNTVVGPLVEGCRVGAIVEELPPTAALTGAPALCGDSRDGLEQRAARMIQSFAVFGAGANVDVIPTSRYAFDLPTSRRNRLSPGTTGGRLPLPTDPPMSGRFLTPVRNSPAMLKGNP
ncbi:hypothetical protein [Rhodococcus sp. NPDC059234]|uniref:hypothetical protein n=1 Tax=Rhodococcus sp. NPDC059234 TaxID=3346781 RepID=UPI00366F94B5